MNKKKILIIIGIGVLVLAVSLLGIKIFLSSPYDYNVTINTNYTKSDLNSMFTNRGYNTYTKQYYDRNDDIELFEEKQNEVNKLLNYIDEVVGKNNYKVDSINNTPKTEHYSVDIVLNKDLDEFYKTINNSSNKYIIEFRSNDGRYSNDYNLSKEAFKYENEIIDKLNSISSQYEYIVDYNPLFHYNNDVLGLNNNSTWKTAIKSKKIESINRTRIYVIGDSSTSLDELEKFVNNNKNVFEDYYVPYVTVIELNQYTSNIDKDNFDIHSGIIKNKKSITIY